MNHNQKRYHNTVKYSDEPTKHANNQTKLQS